MPNLFEIHLHNCENMRTLKINGPEIWGSHRRHDRSYR